MSRRYGVGLRGKLFRGFAAVLVLFFISVLITLKCISDVKVRSDQFLNNSLVIDEVVNDLQAKLVAVKSDVQSLIFLNDQAKIQSIPILIGNLDALLVTTNNAVIALNDPALNETWVNVKKNFDTYKDSIAGLLKLEQSGQHDKAIEYFKSSIFPVTDNLNNSFNIIQSEAKGKGMSNVH